MKSSAYGVEKFGKLKKQKADSAAIRAAVRAKIASDKMNNVTARDAYNPDLRTRSAKQTKLIKAIKQKFSKRSKVVFEVKKKDLL